MVAGAPRRHRPPGQDQSCRPEPPERHERQGDRGGAAREVRAPGVRAERGDRPAVPGALARAQVFPVLFRGRAADRRSQRRPLASSAVEDPGGLARSEEHTSEIQSRSDLVCRLLLEKKKKKFIYSVRRRYYNGMIYDVVRRTQLESHNARCTNGLRYGFVE